MFSNAFLNDPNMKEAAQKSVQRYLDSRILDVFNTEQREKSKQPFWENHIPGIGTIRFYDTSHIEEASKAMHKVFCIRATKIIKQLQTLGISWSCAFTRPMSESDTLRDDLSIELFDHEYGVLFAKEKKRVDEICKNVYSCAKYFKEYKKPLEIINE